MLKKIKSWGLFLATCQKESPGFNIFKILAFPQFKPFFAKKVLKIGEMLKKETVKN